MSHAGHDLSVIDLGIGGTLDIENAGKAALHPRERVIDEGVAAGNGGRELDHHGAARRHGDGLDAAPWLAQHAAIIVDLVEDLADDMEGGGEVRAADTEEDAHALAHLGAERMERRQRADRAVEDEIFGPLAQELLDAELLAAMLPEGRVGIDLALHDVELVIDLGKAVLGLDQDHPV